jgi:hypothetical protein
VELPASALLYLGLAIALAGAVMVVKPIRRLRIRTRLSALGLTAVGLAVSGTACILPTREMRVGRAETHLDEFVPVWQFSELHSLRVAAPPARVYDAIKRVRADEILLFRALTWLRRGGRPGPESILNAGTSESIIDVATRSGFVRLADDLNRELVVGAVVVAPPGTRGTLTPEVFRKALPPGFALAVMNFVVTPDGADASVVSTETRVFANSPDARRRFAAYWRVIYPGSAIIRRMWLRAIRRRAMAE